jgi:hypothetical protein
MSTNSWICFDSKLWTKYGSYTKVTKPKDGLLWTTQDIVQKTNMEKRSTKGKNKRRGDQRKIYREKKHNKKLLRISYWQYIEDIVIPKSLITPGQCVIQWNVFGSTSNKRNPDHQGISFIKQNGKNKHRPYPKILCHGISISQIFSSKENNSSHEFYKKM